VENCSVQCLSCACDVGGQGRGNQGVGGQMTPGNSPGGQTWYFDPPYFLERYFLVHTHTLLSRLQVAYGGYYTSEKGVTWNSHWFRLQPFMAECAIYCQ